MDKRNRIELHNLSFLFLFSLLIILQLLFINKVYAADTPKIYVANTQDNNISVIDSGTNQVIKTIPVPTDPEGMAITLDDKIVYVGSNSTSSVTLINTLPNEVVYSVDVGGGSPDLTLTPDGSELLVAVPTQDYFSIIDTGSNKAVGKVALPGVSAITIDPAGTYGFANSHYHADFSLNEFTVATNAMLFPINTKTFANALSFSPDSKSLYFVLDGKKSVTVLDIFNKSVIAEIPVGNNPYAITFTHDGNTGLVVSRDDGTLTLFNPKTNQVTATINVGTNPYAIAINRDDSKAYVVNEGSNNVSVVDLASKKVIATIAVGKGPRNIVMQRV